MLHTLMVISGLMVIGCLGPISEAAADPNAPGLHPEEHPEEMGLPEVERTNVVLVTDFLSPGQGEKLDVRGHTVTTADGLVPTHLEFPDAFGDGPQDEETWRTLAPLTTEILSPNQVSQTPEGAAPSPWRFEFRPYLQVPFAVDGRLVFDSDDDSGVGNGNGITIGDGDLAVDLGLGLDISQVFLLGGEVEVWYNQYGLLLDGFYATLGTRVLTGQRENSLTGPRETSLELGLDYTRLGAALGWNAGRFPLTSREGIPPEEVFPAVTVDLFGGARYSSYSLDATTNQGELFRLNPNWIEPNLLARTEFLFDPRTKLVLNGYVGGFGLGNAPDFSWGGYAGLDWRFLPNVSLRPSYQFASTAWNGERGSISLRTHSLWLGFSFYFE